MTGKKIGRLCKDHNVVKTCGLSDVAGIAVSVLIHTQYILVISL